MTISNRNPNRYETLVEDKTIYVEADVGRVEVGPLSDVLDFFGEEYVVEYGDWEKERYDVSFSDEGTRMPVQETIEAMSHDKTCIEWLASKPLAVEDAYDDPEDATFSTGRMALFCGFLRDSLEHGPR